MSDLSLQSGPKRTLITSRGAFALAAGRECAFDTGMVESLDFRQPPATMDADSANADAGKSTIVEREHAQSLARSHRVRTIHCG